MAKVKMAKDQELNGQGKNYPGKNGQEIGTIGHGRMENDKNGVRVGKNDQDKYGQIMRHPTQRPHRPV